MAFPTVAATNSGNTTANVTEHTVNLPTGIASGDLLIIIFGVDGQPTVTWPTGYTEFFNALSGTACRLAIAYRIADGSEGASITVTTSVIEGSAHITYRITNWHGTTPPEDSVAAADTTSTPDPNQLTSSWGAEDTLWLATMVHDGGTRTINAGPTNYTNLLTARWNNTGGVGVGSARRELNASSEDPGAFTISAAEEWVAATLGIRPATAAETITVDKWFVFPHFQPIKHEVVAY